MSASMREMSRNSAEVYHKAILSEIDMGLGGGPHPGMGPTWFGLGVPSFCEEKGPEPLSFCPFCPKNRGKSSRGIHVRLKF